MDPHDKKLALPLKIIGIAQVDAPDDLEFDELMFQLLKHQLPFTFQVEDEDGVQFEVQLVSMESFERSKNPKDGFMFVFTGKTDTEYNATGGYTPGADPLGKINLNLPQSNP